MTLQVEQGDVLLWVQAILAAEGHPGPVTMHTAPVLTGTPSTIVSARAADRTGRQAARPELELVDRATGARSRAALVRDLAERREVDGRAVLVELVFDDLVGFSTPEGREASEAVLRSVVEVAPFVLRSGDRVYRSEARALTLILGGTDADGAAVAVGRLAAWAKRCWSDRHLPPATFRARVAPTGAVLRPTG